MSERTCLLNGITTEPCSPQSAIHTLFHGTSGNGGRVGLANVPQDYRNVTLANSPVRASQPKIYEVLDKYAQTFSRQFAGESGVKSLYLWSASPGTGKTTSAIALLHSWLVVHYVGSIQRGNQPEQRPAYFLDAHQLQTEYNGFNRPRVPDHIAEPAAARYYNAIKYAKETEFVVVDDLATRSTSEAFVADLHSVVNARVTSGKPTVYTSNLPIKYSGKKDNALLRQGDKYDLIDVFGEERLADRIGDQCQALEFGGESKRGRR